MADDKPATPQKFAHSPLVPRIEPLRTEWRRANEPADAADVDSAEHERVGVAAREWRIGGERAAELALTRVGAVANERHEHVCCGRCAEHVGRLDD